jgi:hypothetical protein
VRLSAIRHRLLLSLATAQRPVKLRPLAFQTLAAFDEASR